MGICSSKKAVETLNVTSSSKPSADDFSAIKETSNSRFEKVKIHANSKKDP